MTRKEWEGFEEIKSEEEAERIYGDNPVFLDVGEQMLIARKDIALAIANLPSFCWASIIDNNISYSIPVINTFGNQIVTCYLKAEECEKLEEELHKIVNLTNDKAPVCNFIWDGSPFWDCERLIN